MILSVFMDVDMYSPPLLEEKQVAIPNILIKKPIEIEQ